jgi:hypothetical protein
MKAFLPMIGLFFPFSVMAAQFEFSPAPQNDLNRIYRVDRVTGEVGACQFGQKDGSYGVTICYSAGEGAGPSDPSEYGLIASRHEHEAGVFRVDYRTGAMSICYVFEDHVVCTAPEKSGKKP